MTHPQARCDRIGTGHARLRREDPSVRACIERALGDAPSVVDVAGGTGSYDSRKRRLRPVASHPGDRGSGALLGAHANLILWRGNPLARPRSGA